MPTKMEQILTKINLEEIRDIDSVNKFRSNIFNFKKTIQNSVFVIPQINSVYLLTDLWLKFIHLNEYSGFGSIRSFNLNSFTLHSNFPEIFTITSKRYGFLKSVFFMAWFTLFCCLVNLIFSRFYGKKNYLATCMFFTYFFLFALFHFSSSFWYSFFKPFKRSTIYVI